MPHRNLTLQQPRWLETAFSTSQLFLKFLYQLCSIEGNIYERLYLHFFVKLWCMRTGVVYLNALGPSEGRRRDPVGEIISEEQIYLKLYLYCHSDLWHLHHSFRNCEWRTLLSDKIKQIRRRTQNYILISLCITYQKVHNGVFFSFIRSKSQWKHI